MARAPYCGGHVAEAGQSAHQVHLVLACDTLYLESMAARSLLLVKAWSARLSIYTILGSLSSLAAIPCSLIVNTCPWSSWSWCSEVSKPSSSLASLNTAAWAAIAPLACFMAFVTFLSCPETNLCLASAALDLRPPPLVRVVSWSLLPVETAGCSAVQWYGCCVHIRRSA